MAGVDQQMVALRGCQFGPERPHQAAGPQVVLHQQGRGKTYPLSLRRRFPASARRR